MIYNDMKNILEITKGLYKIIKSLDKYTMNTQNLNTKTLRLRNVILNAKDPISLFKRDIPKTLVGKELCDCDRDFLNNLKLSLNELKKRAKKLKLIFDENISVSRTDPRRKFASYVLAKELLKHEENKEILLAIGPEFDENSFYRIHTSNKNSIFYYDESKYGISLTEVINNIHDAGGLAFLAHPLVYPFDEMNKLNEIEIILKNYQLDGLECEYPLFSNQDRSNLKNIALKYKKYVSGGTDYHAKNKPNIYIGTGINNNIYITNEYIKDWFVNVDKI